MRCLCNSVPTKNDINVLSTTKFRTMTFEGEVAIGVLNFMGLLTIAVSIRFAAKLKHKNKNKNTFEMLQQEIASTSV